MKNKRFIALYFFVIIQIVFCAFVAKAQEEEETQKSKPARKAFESAVLIDNQTDVINSAKTLEWNIQHRFGTFQNGSSDMWGLFAPSNIRLGFTYTFTDKLGLGFGLSKVNVSNPYIDLNAKYKIFQQARSGGMPVNVTYFGNVVIDTRDGSLFDQSAHRFSYFHQLIISRRFSSKFSAQISPMISHFNAVDTLYSNDMFALSLAGRYKIGSQSSLMFELTNPLLQHDINDADELIRRDAGPKGNIALGLEISTGSHDFQIFISTYRSILPQQNLTFNTNEFIKEVDGKNKLGFLLGFNMTRLWNY